jgi:hypothetical protein
MDAGVMGDELDHMSLADAIACGLSAILLLFFAVLVNQAVGTSPTAASSVISTEFVFDHPLEILNVECMMDSTSLFSISPKGNLSVPPDGFFGAKPATAVINTPVRLHKPPSHGELSLSVTVGQLRRSRESDPPRWSCDVAVRFPAKPRDLRLEWRFRRVPGLVKNVDSSPRAIRVSIQNNWMVADEQPKPISRVNEAPQDPVTITVSGPDSLVVRITKQADQ